ncbi:thiol reductant ABC exporter subunit CydD [Chryseomicrobium sp. FSL W7-1435]|uniref:thiol reductant ABC exporter subunit CydD n=1 Tax=Chryseomicrobium sp. FSL W7-1435 TaxID=2921704 RepID=UPI00315B04B3
MKTLQTWALQYRKFLLLLMLLTLLLAFTIIGQSYAIVQVVDGAFIQQSTFKDALPYLLALVAFLIVRALINYLNARIGLSLSFRVRESMRAELITKWGRQPLQQSGISQSGDRLTTLIDYVDQLDPYYREYVPQVIKTTLVPVAILISVFWVNPNSGWIMLITAPFIPLSYILVGLKTQQKSERQLAELSLFSGKFLDILQGLQTLKLFGRGKEQADVLKESNAGFQRTTLSILKIAFASTFFIELIITLGIGLLALEIGFQMLVFETLAFAPAFFVLAIAPEYYNSLKELGAAFHTGRGSLAASEKLQKELEKQEYPVKWGTTPVPVPIRLEMNNVTFSYGDSFTLTVDHFQALPNERLVIIGPSGQGKTTLLHVVSGLYEPQQGVITINDKERQTIDESSWWGHTAYISQHPYLFAGTIRENIEMGTPATDTELSEAVTSAGLNELIATLPNGWQTIVGEGGQGLSGGEKQRIALARSFLKKPKLIFYDEPTIGLDVKTERILSESMDRLAKQATVITVAHRLPTIRKADKIAVILEGALVALGTPEQVLEKSSYYAALVQGGQPNEDATSTHT